jgi:hypothetical protein
VSPGTSDCAAGGETGAAAAAPARLQVDADSAAAAAANDALTEAAGGAAGPSYMAGEARMSLAGAVGAVTAAAVACTQGSRSQGGSARGVTSAFSAVPLSSSPGFGSALQSMHMPGRANSGAIGSDVSSGHCPSGPLWPCAAARCAGLAALASRASSTGGSGGGGGGDESRGSTGERRGGSGGGDGAQGHAARAARRLAFAPSAPASAPASAPTLVGLENRAAAEDAAAREARCGWPRHRPDGREPDPGEREHSHAVDVPQRRLGRDRSAEPAGAAPSGLAGGSWSGASGGAGGLTCDSAIAGHAASQLGPGVVAAAVGEEPAGAVAGGEGAAAPAAPAFATPLQAALGQPPTPFAAADVQRLSAPALPGRRAGPLEGVQQQEAVWAGPSEGLARLATQHTGDEDGSSDEAGSEAGTGAGRASQQSGRRGRLGSSLAGGAALMALAALTAAAWWALLDRIANSRDSPCTLP